MVEFRSFELRMIYSLRWLNWDSDRLASVLPAYLFLWFKFSLDALKFFEIEFLPMTGFRKVFFKNDWFVGSKGLELTSPSFWWQLYFLRVVLWFLSSTFSFFYVLSFFVTKSLFRHWSGIWFDKKLSYFRFFFVVKEPNSCICAYTFYILTFAYWHVGFTFNSAAFENSFFSLLVICSSVVFVN